MCIFLTFQGSVAIILVRHVTRVQVTMSIKHHVYKTPWQGDPRVNIQKGKDGKAKAYQVKQVITAIEKLKEKG